MNQVQVEQKSYQMPPQDGFTVAHFLTVADIERSARFYETVFGGRILSRGDSSGAPGYIQIANTWLIVNVGGGPTPDKPSVTLSVPADPDSVSSFMNIRVADIQACYELWRNRGAEFITEPKDKYGETRCYIRDPDGYIIEVGQSKPELHLRLNGTTRENICRDYVHFGDVGSKGLMLDGRRGRREIVGSIMINDINDEVILAARLFLATLFLIFGWRKLRDYSGTVSQMVQDGVPTPVLAAAVAIFMELPVAFAVAVGAFTRPSAVLMALYTLGTSLIEHRYWTITGRGSTRQHGGFLQKPQHYGRLLAVVHYWCGKIFDRCIVRHRRAMIHARAAWKPLDFGPVKTSGSIVGSGSNAPAWRTAFNPAAMKVVEGDGP